MQCRLRELQDLAAEQKDEKASPPVKGAKSISPVRGWFRKVKVSLSEKTRDKESRRLEGERVGGEGGAPGEGQTLRAHLERAKEIREDISGICKQIEHIESLKLDLQRSTCPEKESEIYSSFKQTAADLNQNCARIRKSVCALAQESQSERDTAVGPGEQRMRTNLQRHLMRKTEDLIDRNRAVQEEFQEVLKARTVVRARILCPHVPREELERRMQCGQLTATESLQSGRIQVREMEERLQEFLQIEKDVKALHEAARDLDTIVNANGEIIDRIEEDVMRAKSFVEEGEENLKKAKKHQRRGRRVWITLILVLLGALALLALLAI
uniref:t-SNARE coiled-coil homology domain-containing protein n=1 Tax=Chromera velia CCMP2878 TaxID=1169474 RepID=A0A0G4HDE5_9ALVE|eukprot:Cvel_26347.t1-p1 / transcript=Cvel_26347.t1 / gene=Cvel_26347 / organism=Chromera_velia_CCMP2878 / gene_product=Syntaxin-1A, putative / transcript_product=Syntaxin-1A, putative / location=Cvel_scaffold3119:17897-18871(+) / protein_length=325 / sequence_SO=supercontig / SO=protein_coding / is_pseudo=false